MAKIVVHLDHAITDGEKVTFKAPCNSADHTTLKIYYPTDDIGTETSAEFTIKNAVGESQSGKNGLFATGAYVTVAVDTTNQIAYLHNASTPTDTSRQAKITASGILKGDGAGGVTAATAGTDYAAANHSHNVNDLGNFSTRVYDATTSRTKNTFLAAPNGSNGAATFRTIAAADLPNATASAKGAVIAGSGLSMSTATLNHSNSVTAGTAGTSSATSGATLAVPYVTYDAQGHVTASGTHTHTIGSLNTSALTAGTLGVARGGTGATTFTSGAALVGAGTGAVTTRTIRNNTATSGAVTADTALITSNTLRYAINRTTSVATADTGYTTLMARGIGLRTADTNPGVNGAINFTYE